MALERNVPEEYVSAGESISRLDKHLALTSSISSIDEVIGDADFLLCRITGQGQAIDGPENAANPEMEPSLSEVLDNAPEQISKKCTELKIIINKITEALF